MGRRRTIFALVLAPIGGALTTTSLIGAAAAIGAARSSSDWGSSPIEIFFAQAAIWLFYFVPIALVATWTIGILWHVRMQSERRYGAYNYWGGGLIGGALIAACICLLFSLLLSMPILLALGFSAAFSLLGTICGGMTGLLAWLIRRPDRDAAV